MGDFSKYVLTLAAVTALASLGSLLTIANASTCPLGRIAEIAVCPPLKLPVRAWEGTINGLPAILNITDVSPAGGLFAKWNVMGTITGGDSCYGDIQCNIRGTWWSTSGAISFVNNATSIEKRIPLGIQNFTGQESKAVILDIIRYALAGTGTNIKGGADNKTSSAFNWEFHTLCPVIRPCR
jgi:hypothetical protein